MNRSIVLVLFFFVFFPSVVGVADDDVPVLRPTWESEKLPFAIWGIAKVHGKGDVPQQLILLERHALHLAHREGSSLQVTSTFHFSSLVDAVRLSTIDLDGDGTEEVVVSGIERGFPSSQLIALRDGEFKPLADHLPWHLRSGAIDGSDNRALIGQRSTGDRLFAGRIYRLEYDDGKLKQRERLDLPRGTGLFSFALFPQKEDGVGEALVLKDNEPIEAFEKKRRRFVHSWRSIDRFGGSMNVVHAPRRIPLGIVEHEMAVIDHEPLVVHDGERTLVLAPQHELLLKGMVGREPVVQSGRIVGFTRERSLGFVESFETMRFPGAIADFFVTRGHPVDTHHKNGARSVVLAVQLDPSAFHRDRESAVIVFDLPLPGGGR